MRRGVNKRRGYQHERLTHDWGGSSGALLRLLCDELVRDDFGKDGVHEVLVILFPLYQRLLPLRCERSNDLDEARQGGEKREGERRQFMVSGAPRRSTIADGEWMVDDGWMMDDGGDPKEKRGGRVGPGAHLLVDPSVSVGGVAKVADDNDAYRDENDDHDGKCEPEDRALVASGKVDRRCGANYAQVGHILKMVSDEIVGELRVQVLTTAQWNDDQENQESQLRTKHTGRKRWSVREREREAKRERDEERDLPR